MALQKQNYELPLAAGRDGKTNPKLIAPGKALEVINASLDEVGTLAKRRGYNYLSDDIEHTTDVGGTGGSSYYPQFVRECRGALCICVQGADSSRPGSNGPYFACRFNRSTLEAGSRKFKLVASHRHIQHEIVPGPVPSTEIESLSLCASSSGSHVILMWVSDSEVYLSVYDMFNKVWPVVSQCLSDGSSVYRSAFLLNTSGAGFDYTTYGVINGGAGVLELQAREQDYTQPGSIGDFFVSSTPILNIDDYGTASGAVMDMTTDEDDAYCAYRNTANELQVRQILGGVGGGNSYTDATIAPTAIGICMDSTKTYVFVVVASSAGGRAYKLTKSMSLLTSASVGAGSLVKRLAVGTQLRDGAEELVILTELEYTGGVPSYPEYGRVRAQFVDLDNLLDTMGGNDYFANGSVLAAKPFCDFRANHSNCVAPLAHDSSGQRSLVLGHPVLRGGLTELDFAVDARMLYGSSPGALTDELAPRPVASLGDGRFLMPCRRVDKEEASGVRILTPCFADIRLRPTYPPVSAELAGDTFFSGSKVTQFDGANLTEAGFLFYPRTLSLSSTATTGGALTPGVYSVVLTYEYIDINGNLMRSYPSGTLTHTVPAGGSTQRFEVNAPYLPQTDYVRDKTTRMVLWRTTVDGSIFYRECCQTINDKYDISQLTQIWSQIADSVISQNETLYTTGGVLGDFAPSASNFLASSPTRLFSIPSERPYEVEFSKEATAGVAPAFNEALKFSINREGANTALAVLDSNVVVFKARSIYVVSGRGPNALGEGSFSPPRRIASDSGCVDPSSVLTTDTGVYFRSHRGFRFLTRGLQVSPTIAHEVEDFHDKTCISAVLMRDRQEARFVHSDGTVLVHNYEQNLWCLHTSATHFTSDIKDATVLDDDMVTANENGLTGSIIMAESASLYTDDDTDGTPGVSYSVQIDTPWIKLAGLQGFSRLYWVGLLGEYKTAHTLTIGVYYDYVETVAETITVSPTADPAPYLYRFKPAKQKCQAVRFRISDSAGGGTEENFTLTGLAVEVGIKRGTAKLSAAKTL